MTLQAARLNKMLGAEVFTVGVAVDDTVCADATGLTVEEVTKGFIFQSHNNFKDAVGKLKESNTRLKIEYREGA